MLMAEKGRVCVTGSGGYVASWLVKLLLSKGYIVHGTTTEPAESEALEYAKRSGLDVVTVCPALVIGPMLQSILNASSMFLIKLLKDGSESMVNKVPSVDVRDVADALLLAYEKAEAEGRYICTAHTVNTQELVDKLRSLCSNYSYQKNFSEDVEAGGLLSSEKLQRLGWKYRTLEETLVDSVQSYQEAGLLDKN